MRAAEDGPGWRVLVTPRWLAWHAFALLAVAGMLWLGDWQFRRAEAGNPLSWAYTFEWPVFAVLGVVFWIKTIRDELNPPAPAATGYAELPDGVGTRPSGAAQPAGDDDGDPELDDYNEYLARLSHEVKGHGRWHGFR
jgi:hypothetical protein